MGLATNMLILYFCITFVLWLGVPNAASGFTSLFGSTSNSITNVVNINLIAIIAAGVVVGIGTAIVTHDVMTTAISGIVTALSLWFIVPTSFAPDMPSEINIFIVGFMALIWGMAMIGLFRGYEP